MAARRGREVAAVVPLTEAEPDQHVLVSVVIPVLNEQASIGEALQRLLALPMGLDIIVVDGGSQDLTPSIVQRFITQLQAQVKPARHRCQWVQSERGRALQMNAGAALAQGEILLFLHADTQLPGNFIQVMQNFLSDGARWGRFDVRLSGEERVFRVISWFMNRRSRTTGIATGDQGIFVTESFFKDMGGFTNIPLMEDVEFTRRAKQVSQPYCSRAYVVTDSRRWRLHGIIKTVTLMWWLRFAYFIGVPAQTLHRWYYPQG